jgi:hypothetical protein
LWVHRRNAPVKSQRRMGTAGEQWKWLARRVVLQFGLCPEATRCRRTTGFVRSGVVLWDRVARRCVLNVTSSVWLVIHGAMARGVVSRCCGGLQTADPLTAAAVRPGLWGRSGGASAATHHCRVLKTWAGTCLDPDLRPTPGPCCIQQRMARGSPGCRLAGGQHRQAGIRRHCSPPSPQRVAGPMDLGDRAETRTDPRAYGADPYIAHWLRASGLVRSRGHGQNGGVRRGSVGCRNRAISSREALRSWFGQQGDRWSANVAGLHRPRHLMHWSAAKFDVDVSGGSRLPTVSEAG